MGAIEFRNVSRRFENGTEALRSVNLVFEEGSMHFLTGHSGAGKSTFLRLLLRLDVPTRGQILVNGVNVGALSESRIPAYRQHIGAVFQDHHLLAERTVYDNVALPLRVAGMREREVARRVRAAVSRVGLLAKEQLLPRQLSTGEQQRVGIARAVVNRPRILLADEPTGNLDPALSLDILHLFEQFQQVGTTVIIASHAWELIERLGKPIVHLSNGAVLSAQGLPAEVRPSRVEVQDAETRPAG